MRGQCNLFPSTRTVRGISHLALVAVLLLGGCRRAFYREQADRDAYGLINQKANDPRWQLPDSSIEVDPRSRMFDPFDPDRQPMPPDDPTSHQLMHRVDHKRGYPHWHANGDVAEVENPAWLAYLPLNEEGILVLNAERAVELAQLHSPDYQQQLETLYLSALDVSFERFRFDTQFYGGYALDYRADGPLRNPLLGSQSVLTAATFPNIRAERLFATGSELVVGFANSLVWQFSGPDTYTSSTLLDFTLLQPLLRGAGRDRVLERLTLAERTLLANVRQMERFRRGFYVEVMTGRSAGRGPSRRGGVFGAGLEGFTGIGGGFGGVGGGGGGVGGAGGGTGGGQAGGFIGLLQRQQEIRNQQDNLTSLRSNYFRLLVTLQELLTTIPEQSESVVRQRLQVAQARSAMLNAESRLLNVETPYQTQLDTFKATLGLPPEICVRIEDPMLERVSLIDPAIRPVQDQVGQLQQRVGDLALKLLSQDGVPLEWSDEVAAHLRELRAQLDEVADIRGRVMLGDDAQILRIREDGLKLARKLRETLVDALAASSGDAERAAELQQDLRLLDEIVQRIEGETDWLDRLSGFLVIRDALADIARVQQQLVRFGLMDLDWMRTDTNPATRELYQQFRPALEGLRQLPADEQAVVKTQLSDELLVRQQQAAQQLQRILDQSPWLAELDRWRYSPDEVEVAAESTGTVELRRLKRLVAQFVDTMIDIPARINALPGRVEEYQRNIDALIAEGPRLTPAEFIARFRRDISPAIPQELVDLSENVLLLSLMQARDRAETVGLIEVDLHPAVALDIARANRRDWMNARASLVDSWRLIEFNADDLESGLDVVFSGDIQNRTDNPFSLDAKTGRLRVGLQFDAPLTRLSERNTYRQALIEYQQARRSYYQFQDGISRTLRETLRVMQLNEENFEIRREAVRAADLQIELNEDLRRIQEANRQPSGPTAARDAVSALDDLLTAQNDFLSVWVTYEVLRRTLDFDLGTMELDQDGMWIDPGPIGPQQGLPGIESSLSEECWPGPVPGGGAVPLPCCPAGTPLEIVPAQP